jgi:hypothetical protein
MVVVVIDWDMRLETLGSLLLVVDIFYLVSSY